MVLCTGAGVRATGTGAGAETGGAREFDGEGVGDGFAGTEVVCGELFDGEATAGGDDRPGITELT